MKITALVENKSLCDLKPKHGLSRYIETAKHKILFDLGSDSTLFENAKKLNLDLTEVDIVVISHGHIDHGGALEKFLQINKKAKVFIQKTAFNKHYSKVLVFKVKIGLDKKLENHPQIILIDGNYKINDELELLTVKNGNKCYSPINDVLYSSSGKDSFEHEQNLKIDNEILIMGCGHKGIINILDEVKCFPIKACIGGYHLFNPISKKTVSNKLLDEIAIEMNKHEILYYTCHCTGEAAYNYLKTKVANLKYLSSGESIDL